MPDYLEKENFVERHLRAAGERNSSSDSDRWASEVERLCSNYELDPRIAKAFLMNYRSRQTGSDLFKAFTSLLSADKPMRQARIDELEKLKALADSIDPAQFVAALIESTRLELFAELEPIMADLVRFCDAPGRTEDQLPNINSALRIGKGHTPREARLKRERDHMQYMWWESLHALARTGVPRSRNEIADEIAGKFNSSRQRAIDVFNRINVDWAKDYIQKLEKRAEKPQQVRVRNRRPAPPRKGIRFGRNS